MKIKLTRLMSLAILCVAAGALPAWAQNARMVGTITDKGTPIVGAQIICKSTTTGRVVKFKSDKKGTFDGFIPDDTYNITVTDASGKTIYSHDNLGVGESGEDNRNILTIDLTNGTTFKSSKGVVVGSTGDNRSMGGAHDEFHGPGQTSDTGTKVEAVRNSEEQEKVKAQNTKVEGINGLFAKYQAAVSIKDWAGEIAPLQGMIAADPSRWEYYEALGDAQVNTADYASAVQSYDKGIQTAQGYASGTVPKNSKDPYSDPAKAKAGMGEMYAGEGDAYLKLQKTPEAIAAYTKGAELDRNPGIAYFNLCATQYNIGNMDGAAVTCNKAIQADPTRADAYFIEGSAMYGNGKMDADKKYVVPPGTAEALKKYLELAPNGAHAADVKAMLDALGVPIETSYKGSKKK